MLNRGWPVLAKDRRGGIAIIGALAATSLIGVAAFAVDVSYAYTQRSQLQKVADSAAAAGAVSWVKSGSSTATMATIQDIVVANGWPATIIQSPAAFYVAASPKNSSNHAIQVSLAAPYALTLGRVISSATSLTTHAVSIVEISGASKQTACMLSLTTLMVNATINTPGCAVVANSTASNAVTVNSGGKITAAAVATPGKVVNNGTINATIKTGATAATNPFSSYASQASSGFKNCVNYSNQSSLTPGCWSNVNVNSGTLTLSAGTYFFTGLNVNSGGSISGTGGVTIVTQNNFSPNGPVTITAPGTGSWAGMAIYASGGLNMNSGVTYTVNGAIYSPTTAINLNSATWNQNACTYLVSYSLTFNSGSNINLPQTNCSSYAFPAPSIATGTSTVTVVQ